MGHVMLVIKGPERVGSDSNHARPLKSVWPADVQEIWKLRTLESARGRAGLHEANLYLYVQPNTRILFLLGELADGEFDFSNEATELWQSPPELRLRLSDDAVQEVLDDMKEQNSSANWSWTTAARAVLLPDWQLSDSSDKQQLLQEIQDCWARDPICTSVVIIFWQRLLCQLASVLRQDIAEVRSADLILEWFPLKADRSLPGPLLDTMLRCGWTKRTVISPDMPDRQRRPLAKREPDKAVLPSRPGSVQDQSQSMTPQGDDAPAGTSIAMAAPPPKAASISAASLALPTGAQSPPMPPPQRLSPSLTAKYCALHHRSEKRPKAEARICRCSACQVVIETNYAEMTLCPPCSNKQDRCMVCGSSTCAPETAGACSLGPPLPVIGEDSSKRNIQAPSFGPLPHANPAEPIQQAQGGPPRYCGLHDRSDRRKKGEPRVRGCMACNLQIETNYAEMSFCPPCSQRFDRCMVCGKTAASGPPAWARFPPSTAPVKAEEATNASRLQMPSRYCSRHDSTLKRTKAEPKSRECTVCHMLVESNYAEFSLCPPCSGREHRCVLCGCPAATVASGGSCMVPTPMPGLLAR